MVIIIHIGISRHINRNGDAVCTVDRWKVGISILQILKIAVSITHSLEHRKYSFIHWHWELRPGRKKWLHEWNHTQKHTCYEVVTDDDSGGVLSHLD